MTFIFKKLVKVFSTHFLLLLMVLKALKIPIKNLQNLKKQITFQSLKIFFSLN